jgi:hypothetical protein
MMMMPMRAANVVLGSGLAGVGVCCTLGMSRVMTMVVVVMMVVVVVVAVASRDLLELGRIERTLLAFHLLVFLRAHVLLQRAATAPRMRGGNANLHAVSQVRRAEWSGMPPARASSGGRTLSERLVQQSTIRRACGPHSWRIRMPAARGSAGM